MVNRQEAASGWRSALALAVRVLILNPHEPVAADLVLGLINQAKQIEMLTAVLELLQEAELHPYLALAYTAARCI